MAQRLIDEHVSWLSIQLRDDGIRPPLGHLCCDETEVGHWLISFPAIPKSVDVPTPITRNPHKAAKASSELIIIQGMFIAVGPDRLE